MTYSFNLVDKSWIPCILPDGSARDLGLYDTLIHAHEIREVFDQSPLVTAALHRLLLAFLHRNFGPASRSEWKTLWSAGRFDQAALGVYFTTWKPRFDLFDEQHPFYQVSTFKTKDKEVEVNDILPELARGNNPTLFDHTTDETSSPLSPSAAARTLVTLQAYKLGGLSGLGANYVDAPIARSVYVLVVGSTLFETLLLNLVRYNGDDPMPVIGADCPVWERDDPATSSTPRGYLDYLTWQTLFLRLLPQPTLQGSVAVARVQIALGRNFKRGQVFDPGCAYTKNAKAKPNQEPWPSLRYHQARSLWRDSTTLLRLPSQEAKPPSSPRWVAQLVDDGILNPGAQYRLAAYGLCPDQANILFWRQERMPLPVRYLADENLVERLDFALRRAEDAATALRKATTHLARRVLYPNRQDAGIAKAQAEEAGRFAQHLAATELYWSSLEIPFFAFLQTLPNDSGIALAGWIKTLQATALHAFDETVRGLDQSARVLRAVVESRQTLMNRLRHALQP